MMFRLALTTLAGLLAQQALLGQVPDQQVSLCVTTQIGQHGSFCEPFQCRPWYTVAAPGEMVRFDIGGARGTSFVMFTGSSVNGCQPIPGIAGGALALWYPITTVMIGSLADFPMTSRTIPLYPCSPATASFEMMMPKGLPAGLDVRFQVLGTNDYAKMPRLEFSRAVEVRIH